ncbi:hypothetical protein COU14_03220 [Candidatus Kaiserbacteria bacterium CG10_big_fil_rev_8_21_14_0_10_44_10]|uniref:Uncharacterized protein n=1 Tax=Candidatus Kaiserbacteria bacterium CG10_big_fil_rev_8_21_14_0_10_44_10 TaxID=1974606 RepID=A0A2H0UGV6_9BACT|nr:MAG: hypothetical protein COU14_03220 [Candidatus Kaiserbacteria bacterium CG10_big_fil_rev_8_21_14_0_10_44_10]
MAGTTHVQSVTRRLDMKRTSHQIVDAATMTEHIAGADTMACSEHRGITSKPDGDGITDVTDQAFRAT